MKYAFVDRNEGKIAIKGSVDDNMLTVVYEDDGVEVPDSIDLENSTGFGFEMIHMFSKQIGGKIEITRGGGTKFTMDFDLGYAAGI